ncbi:MAG TPA: PRC-barrel domain-containing protein [Phycisphaerae bacterium]
MRCFKWVSYGLYIGMLMLLTPTVGAQTSGAQREPGQPRERNQMNDANLQRLMSTLDSSTVNLIDAIRKAEQHVSGRAVAARLMTGEALPARTERERDMGRETRENQPGQPGAAPREPGTTGGREHEPGMERGQLGREMTGQEGTFEIFCIANGRMMEVRVDGNSGNILGANERHDVPFAMGGAYGHMGRAHELTEFNEPPVARAGTIGNVTAPSRIQKASDLIKKNLKGQGGEDLGEAKDLAIDVERAKVAFVIVELGKDVEGMKGKLVAIPFTALNLPGDAHDFVLVVDRGKLGGAPTIEKDKINKIDVNLANNIFTHYGQSPYWEGQLARRALGGGRTTDIESESPGTLRIQKASDLFGKDVKNTGGEKLGDVKDLAIDPDHGQVPFVVVSVGTLGTKWVAIPFSALSLPADAKNFNLDMSAERFKNAPTFERDQWGSMTDTNWNNNIYSFYGVRPYWERARTTDIERDRDLDRERERERERGNRP